MDDAVARLDLGHDDRCVVHPDAVTVDFDTLDDQAVTVRDRDTMEQDRVSIDQVAGYLRERLS